MKKNIRAFYTILLIFMLFLMQCQEADPQHEYISYINNLETLDTSESSFLTADSGVYSPHLLDITDNGIVVIVDHSTWQIHLFDFEGNKLSEAGGIGSGPGEFRVINNLVITPENKILLLDKGLNRLTEYVIENEGLILEGTKQLPDNSNYNIEDIYYVESDGYYGVFSKRGQSIETNINRDLFKLNNNLEISEKLLSLPEDDVINTDTPSEDWGFGFVTKWYFDDTLFYYSNSESLSWFKYELSNDKSDTVIVSDVPEYYKTVIEEEYLINRFGPLIQKSPGVMEVIEERERLSLFNNMVVGSGNNYHTVINFSGEPGKILQINRSSKIMKKVKIPYMFFLFALHKNSLLGIDYNESAVVKITMDDMSISMK